MWSKRSISVADIVSGRWPVITRNLSIESGQISDTWNAIFATPSRSFDVQISQRSSKTSFLPRIEHLSYCLSLLAVLHLSRFGDTVFGIYTLQRRLSRQWLDMDLN